MSIWFLYKSISSDNIYPLELDYKYCYVKELCYRPKDVWDWCEKGCKNYNYSGGCPPKSPLLEKLYDNQHPVYLLYCRFWANYKPLKVKESRNSAIHWKFQDAILARFLYNIAKSIVNNNGGGFLSSGYCLGCPGIKCNFKLGLNYCRNPRNRSYSMEATGIDVVTTLNKIFKLPVYWYGKGNTDIPYMIKCIAYFPPNEVIDFESIIKRTLNSMKNCYAELGSPKYNFLLNRLKI